MNPLGWLALGGACGVLALPRPVVARTAGLAGAGRLRRGAGGVDRAARLRAATSAGWLRGVAAMVTGFALLLLGWRVGPAPAVVAATVALVVTMLVRDAVCARRVARRHRALLTAIRVLAGELEAGASPADALLAAAATGPAARSLAAFVEGGAGDDPVLRALRVAWSLAGSTGAALVGVVERVAADLAARDTQRRAVAVAVAGPRASAVMLALLPAVGLLLGAAMGARPLAFLFADPAGQLVCCAGVVLDAAGLLWVRRIVGRVR